MPVAIRKFELDDRPSVLNLVKALFGGEPMANLAKRWDWQFSGPPACRQVQTQQWVAEDDLGLAGYIGSYPAYMKVLDRELVVHLECDLVSDETARRRDPTMAMRLLRAFMESGEHLFANAFVYTDMHQKLRVWLKHKPVQILPIYFRPYRTGALLRFAATKKTFPNWLVAGPVGSAIAAATTGAVSLLNLMNKPAVDRSIRVEAVSQTDDRFDELWSRLKDKFPIIMVRDRAFLEWRFEKDPIFKNTVLGAFAPDGTLIGYAVVRTNESHGMKMGRIMDIFCDPDSPRTSGSLVAACLGHFERQKVDVVTCLGLHPKLQKVARKSLYISQPRKRAAKRSMALLQWNGDPELSDAIYDESNWHFSHADGDRYFDP